MSQQQQVDSILSATWVLPMNGQQDVLNSHALVIDQEKIIDVLPIKTANEQYISNNNTHLDQHVLMPGLINAHGHSAMSLLRGYADDLPLMDWLENHIWPVEGQFVDADFVYQGTQLAMAEMLLSGTTTFSDMYFFPNHCARAAKDAGMRMQAAFPIFNVPSAWGSGSDEYISKGLELFDQYRDDALINIAFGPHAPYTTDDASLERVATLASELDAPIQMHVHETEFEVLSALEQNKERPIARLNRLGLLSPRFQAVHCTQLNEDDIETLKNTNASVVHCPESNLKLASGICPTAKLLGSGINVAIGTDGAASNNDLDLFSELRTAALIAKANTSDSTALPAMQALEMATIKGAQTLGLGNAIGSLETGKYADVIALDLNRIDAQPCYDIPSLLTYSNCANWVEHVWVNGKQLVKNRELLTLDTQAILANTQRWQALLSKND